MILRCPLGKHTRRIARSTRTIALALACYQFAQSDTLQPADRKIVDSYIARQARQEKGEEYGQARKIATGDLNHDGTPDLAVLYTIEGQGGSNRYVQYLAVFVRSTAGLQPVARVVAGGKLERDIDGISVHDNGVDLETMKYGPNDPACCPSIKGKTRYTLEGRSLKEQK